MTEYEIHYQIVKVVESGSRKVNSLNLELAIEKTKEELKPKEKELGGMLMVIATG